MSLIIDDLKTRMMKSRASPRHTIVGAIILSSVIVITTNYYRVTINCNIPDAIRSMSSFVEDQCLMSDMYTLRNATGHMVHPEYSRQSVDGTGFINLPGVTKHLMTTNYQWIVLLLILQSFSYLLIVRLYSLMFRDLFHLRGAFEEYLAGRETRMDVYQYVDEVKRNHPLIKKVAFSAISLANSVLQIFVLHWIFDVPFGEQDLSIKFPRRAYCTVDVTLLGGNIHGHVVDCFLMSNIVYEKIFQVGLVILWVALCLDVFVLSIFALSLCKCCSNTWSKMDHPKARKSDFLIFDFLRENYSNVAIKNFMDGYYDSKILSEPKAESV